MQAFKDYLTESSDKNIHLEHLEDQVLNRGIAGAREAITFLLSLRDMLAGHTEKPVSVTTKWDGCIHPDSLVMTQEGMKRIEDVVPGDFVLSKDLEANTDAYSTVLAAKIDHKGKPWISIELEHGTITLTTDHKVFTTNRGWVEAGFLTLEDDIQECDLLDKFDGKNPTYLGGERA